MEVVQACAPNLTLDNISRCHRVGKPEKDKDRPIIVKFTSYRYRKAVFSSRKNLKDSHKNVYVNEDLTRNRSKLLYDARQMCKAGALASSWSMDGIVFVKQFQDGPMYRINCTDDLHLLVE